MDSILNVLRIAFLCVEVVLIFNLVIVVHEVGHFLAARWRGLVIDRFGIWFGKPIWKRRYNGVDYCLGWIPAGGYVALPQMASMETIEGKTNDEGKPLPPIKPIDKIIVAAAGPLFSILLALVFAVLVMLVGKPVSQGDVSTVVGYAFPGMPAAQAVCSDTSVGPGLKPGDKILEVDNKPVHRFGGMNDSIKWRIVRSEGSTIPFLVERDGRKLLFTSQFDKEQKPFWMRQGMREVGLIPEQQPMIAEIPAGSAPEKAGLQPNDVILAVNGAPVYSEYGFDELLAKSPSAPSKLTIRRGKQTLELELPPMHPVIASVAKVKNSPAIAAGLKAGDVVVSANGESIYSIRRLIDLTSESNGAPIKLAILREGKPMEITVVPAQARVNDSPQPGYKMGVQLRSQMIWDSVGETTLVYPNPFEEIASGVTTMVNTLTAILSPKSDLKVQHLGGPVQITRVYYLLLESPEGWRRALWFSILLNVNLAVMNLLPLPVLDGGHITLALLEIIRRRPLNARIMEALQTSCALLLIGFMLFVTFYDVGELVLFRGERSTFEFIAPEAQTPP